jgi:excisionase family DNA binding protein
MMTRKPLNNNIIVSHFSLDDLISTITQGVVAEIKPLLSVAEQKPNATKYLSRKEVATLLGFSMPKIDRLTAKGVLPSYKIGKQTRFIENEVLKVIASLKQ